MLEARPACKDCAHGMLVHKNKNADHVQLLRQAGQSDTLNHVTQKNTNSITALRVLTTVTNSPTEPENGPSKGRQYGTRQAT